MFWASSPSRPGAAVELGPPLRERAVAVRDGRELQRGHVVVHAHGALQDGVRALEVVVGQGQQLLADAAAILEAKVADAADRVGGQAALDPRVDDERASTWATR
jgi:hypothetical protein